MSEHFSVIIIGAGPAGATVALTLAKNGIDDVLVLERGHRPGAKNLFGGIVYAYPLDGLVDPFPPEDFPVERRVTRRAVSLTGPTDALHLTFSTPETLGPCYTAHRAAFDQWLADQAEKAGATVLNGTVVDGLLKTEDGKVRGVRVRTTEGERTEEGELTADLIIDAEGVNPRLVQEAGFLPPMDPQNLALGVKETRSLPETVIEDRFHLEGDEGIGWEWYGEVSGGLWGSGFIYTNRSDISLGVVISVEALMKSGKTPHDLLEGFKAHPAVAPLLRGSVLEEYGAHLIPETPGNRLPTPITDGMILVGDAAGLVNLSPYHEGINLAFLSGRAAAETYLNAPRGQSLSKEELADYPRRLAETVGGRDLAAMALLGETLLDSPELIRDWPSGITAALRELVTVDGRSKAEAANRAWLLFNSMIGMAPFAFTTWKFLRALAPGGEKLIQQGMGLLEKLKG